LDLTGSTVSEEQLRYLRELRKLKVLVLSYTSLTDAQINNFMAEMPSGVDVVAIQRNGGK
jgi:hypothetical protein